MFAAGENVRGQLTGDLVTGLVLMAFVIAAIVMIILIFTNIIDI